MSATPDREAHERADVPEHRWFPSDWMDELNPAPLASPDDYIQRVPDGERVGYRLGLPADYIEADNEAFQTTIEVGQVVKYQWVEHYGDIHVMIRGEEPAETNRPVPAAAEQFYESSTGTLCLSFDEMVEELRAESGGQPYRVHCYTWSHPIPFRFDVDAEGARFVQCAGVS